MKRDLNINKQLIYIALGDSLTAGIGAILKPGFVKRFSALVEKKLNKKVISFVIAKNGAKTGHILSYLQQPLVQYIISRADIITISAGGNDLRKAAKLFLKSEDERVLERGLKTHREDMLILIHSIKQLKSRQKKPYLIRIVDIYNPFPNLPLSDKWVRKFNQQLKSFEGENIAVTNIHSAFMGREKQILSIDRLHPNADGYQVIAEELDKLGYAPIISKSKVSRKKQRFAKH